MPKMSWHVKKFKVEERINRWMSFRIDDEKLLQKHKAFWTKIKDSKNVELKNDLPVYDDRYIKTEIKAYDDKVYTNFLDLNVPEDDM